MDDIRRVTGRFAELEWDDPAKLPAQARELERLENEVGFDELVGLARRARSGSSPRASSAPTAWSPTCGISRRPGPAQRGEVDLQRGLESTLQLVRHALREARVELRVEIAENLPLLTGDARALNQVFLNLLKNAAEALEGRGGIVTLSAVADGAWVVVRGRGRRPGDRARAARAALRAVLLHEGSRQGDGPGAFDQPADRDRPRRLDRGGIGAGARHDLHRPAAGGGPRA